MKLSRGAARFNKRVTNRIQGLYAWLLPPWAQSSFTAVDARAATIERPSLHSDATGLSLSRCSTARSRIGFAICGPGVGK
jgi:hypothetical protein